MPKYKLVIFDSDGTLADTLPWFRSVYNQLADKHAFRRVEEREYEELRDLAGSELLRRLGMPLWKLPLVVRSMRTLMKQHVHELSLFPGIADALRGLSATGVLTAVVSSNSRGNVEAILGPERASLVNFYSCGASMFGKAPRLRAVTRSAGVTTAETLYVGDEIRDGEAAREAGAHFGAVAWGQHSISALQKQNPAEVFHAVKDLDRLAR